MWTGVVCSGPNVELDRVLWVRSSIILTLAAISFAQTGWFANRAWVESNAGTARAFATTLITGAEWAAEPAHHAESPERAARRTSVR